MTFKELILSADIDESIKDIIKNYFPDYIDTEKSAKIYKLYIKVINQLLHSKKKSNSISNLKKIIITKDLLVNQNDQKPDNNNKYFEYCCVVEPLNKQDPQLKDQLNPQYYCIDFIDWKELIDLPIEDQTKKFSIEQMLTIILAEITFWGFSPKAIKKNKKIFIEHFIKMENKNKNNFFVKIINWKRLKNILLILIILAIICFIIFKIYI